MDSRVDYPGTKGVVIEMADGNEVAVITVDLTQRLGPSKSGKTMIVATTGGFVELAGGARLSLNVIR